MLQPFCSVIVLNYQGEKFVARTLNSLLELDYPKDRYEILVVDNASEDRSREVIDAYLGSDLRGSPQVQPNRVSLYLTKNFGFSAGNNAGIRQSKGEYIVLLNNDCIVEKNWLRELVKTADNDSSIFAVNSKIMLGKSNKIQNAGIRIFANGYAQDIGAKPQNKKQDYEEDTGQYEKEREIDGACAAASLYRKSILDQIGLLDEDFFMYYEDVEISERAKKHGYKIMYCPKAVVHHEHAASAKEWSPFFIYHSERGRLMHMLLHFPLSVFLKEYVVFKIKAKARFLIRFFTNPKSTRTNWQYIRVSWFFILNGWRLLLKKRGL